MKILTIALAVAALTLAVAPAQAHNFPNPWSGFDFHIKKTVKTDLPDKVVPPEPTTSHGPEWGEQCGPFSIDVPMPGGKVFCVADIDSWAFKGAAPGYTVDGGTETDCKNLTFHQTTFFGWPVGRPQYVGSTTSSGACPSHPVM